MRHQCHRFSLFARKEVPDVRDDIPLKSKLLKNINEDGEWPGLDATSLSHVLYIFMKSLSFENHLFMHMICFVYVIFMHTHFLESVTRYGESLRHYVVQREMRRKGRRCHHTDFIPLISRD